MNAQPGMESLITQEEGRKEEEAEEYKFWLLERERENKIGK